MKNYYNLIWNDAINSIRKTHPNDSDWKQKVFILVTFANSLNLWIVFIWLDFLGFIHFDLGKVIVTPISNLNIVFSFVIVCVLPVGLLNYFLIFHKNRYEKVLSKYKNIKTSYSFIYSISIIIIFIISVYIHGYVKI